MAEEFKQNLEIEVKNQYGATMTGCYGRKTFKEVQAIIAALGKEPDSFGTNVQIVSIKW